MSLTTKDNIVKEYGKQLQVSAEMLNRMDKTHLENFIKENIRMDAEHEGWVSVSEPEMFWGEQAYRVSRDEENYLNYVRCEATDEGAFFYVGAKMKVVQQ